MNQNKIAFLHIPKTGGGWLEGTIHSQTTTLGSDGKYLFNFFGQDQSKGKNWKGPSELFANQPHKIKSLLDNEHFQQSKIITGHFSYNLLDMLKPYTFDVFSIIRNPIDRVISNIIQYTNTFTPNPNNSISEVYHRFGKHNVSKPGTVEYWDQIYDILSNDVEMSNISSKRLQHPSIGVLIYEYYMLNNCMVHMYGGSNIGAWNTSPNLSRAKENLKNIKIARFEDYNQSLTNVFDDIKLPVDISANSKGESRPRITCGLKKAPQKVYNMLENSNMMDLELYYHIMNSGEFY